MKAEHGEMALQMDVLMPIMLDRLQNGQTIRFSPNGKSMLPMLRQGRDSVELSPISGKLRKYDLPLYRRRDGKYILHRIVQAGETYVCMGDNQFYPEPGVRQDQLIAVVTAFYRDGKRYTVYGWFYRAYCVLWHYTRPLRRFWKRCISWIDRRAAG